MCCDDLLAAMPSSVEAMLDRYRGLAAERPWDWGNNWSRMPFYAVQMIPCYVPVPLSKAINGKAPILRAAYGEISPAEAMLEIVDRSPPPGVSVVDLSAGDPAIRTGAAPYAMAGSEFQHVLLVRGRRDTDVTLDDGGGREVIRAGQSAWLLLPGRPDGSVTVSIDGLNVEVADVVEFREAAELEVTSDVMTRWSIIDDRGGGWFAPGRPHKWDTQYRPFFHARSATVRVPAAALTVTAGRGIEWEPATEQITVEAGETSRLSLAPRRLFDPGQRRWLSADLHVHMNVSGDLVVTPEQAASMQLGEGLNVMSLVTAAGFDTHVYDREAFEATAGRDLPWSDERHIARFGVEFRNDLFGHIHALSPSAPPTRYQTGHALVPESEDWPSNAVVAQEFRNLGATTGYAHPVWQDIPEDGSFEHIFGGSWRGERSVEARELVADAALGLIDSLDVLSPANNRGSAHLYHRLLGAGCRLAASAGTDVFLSFSHGLAADPPGWSRVYCRVDGPLSVDAIKSAIRRGATVATNGPWLELDVDDRGPGKELSVSKDQLVRVRARTEHNGVEKLDVLGPDGVIAASSASAGGPIEITADVRVHESAWIAAVASGGAHQAVCQGTAYAHTTPVYVLVGDAPIARRSDVEWCTRWLARLSQLVREHGRYTDPEHRQAVLDVIDSAAEHYSTVAARAHDGPFLTFVA